MSTHASALLLAALAYAFARRYAHDVRFTFGTGKLGDLAGFTSAIILAMIAFLIGYEAILRLFAPMPIQFAEAISVACLGLGVNVASAWLLSGDDHRHGRSHGHPDSHSQTRGEHHDHDESNVIAAHEHALGAAARDNNMSAAIIHVLADAAVSVLVIVGLSVAWALGWLWMDPVAGIAGACVIASWSAGLIRDTGAILLDMNPDRQMSRQIRAALEEDGNRLPDLHLWRLGPGHLGAIVSVVTPAERSEAYFRAKLGRFRSLSHLAIEVRQMAQASPP